MTQPTQPLPLRPEEALDLDIYDKDVLKRLKRIESKLTVLLRHQGLDDWGVPLHKSTTFKGE